MRFASLPGGLGRGDVARAILRLPGEALAHGAPLDLVAEALDRRALAGRPRALDELHHADAKAAAERAKGQTEGRRRLALAGAGMDDQQPLLRDRLRGDLGVLRRLALGHLRLVAVVGFGHMSVLAKGKRIASAGLPVPSRRNGALESRSDHRRSPL